MVNYRSTPRVDSFRRGGTSASVTYTRCASSCATAPASVRSTTRRSAWSAAAVGRWRKRSCSPTHPDRRRLGEVEHAHGVAGEDRVLLILGQSFGQLRDVLLRLRKQ